MVKTVECFVGMKIHSVIYIPIKILIVVRMKVMKIVDSLAVDNVENDRIIR